MWYSHEGEAAEQFKVWSKHFTNKNLNSGKKVNDRNNKSVIVIESGIISMGDLDLRGTGWFSLV